jgi:FAD/FMN-containing dehydrogenase
METLLAALRAAVGDAHVFAGDEAQGMAMGGLEPEDAGAAVLVRPANTEEVASVLTTCNDLGTGVVPLGGGTGLVGGTNSSPGEVVVSLERFRSIEVDPVRRVAVAGAGVTLQQVHDTVGSHGLAFGIDLGARGTAQVGGLVATNAGGSGVLRWGMMRANLLGIEAVLADGTRIDTLEGLEKDNTGFDLTGLLCGSEGTLGIVTRATLRLHPAPSSRNTALAAVPSFDALLALRTTLDERLGGEISAFEVMWESFYRTIAIESGNHTPPLPDGSPLYALIESRGHEPVHDEHRFQAALSAAADHGLLTDAVAAMSGTDRDRLWAIRDDIPALVRAMGTRLAYDVSLPVTAIPAYLEAVGRQLGAPLADQLVVFGHLGDGNLHLTLPFDPVTKAIADQAVYDALVPFAGSVSAEHGIGLEKRAWLGHTRSEGEIQAMRRIKRALDPNGIMNPGKLLGLTD